MTDAELSGLLDGLASAARAERAEVIVVRRTGPTGR